MYNFYNLNPNLSSTKTTDYVTLEINQPLHNDTFYELFNTYTADPTEENQDKLGHYLNTIDYLIGFFPNENFSENQPQITIKKYDDLHLLICSTPQREVYLPVFTATTEIRSWCQDTIHTLSVPAAWLWKFILSQNNFMGIVINPGNMGWTINCDHIRSLLEDITTT